MKYRYFIHFICSFIHVICTAWVFLLRTFTHSDWIRRDTPYLSVFRFSPNTGKYGPEKLRIRTLFTHCWNNKTIYSTRYNQLGIAETLSSALPAPYSSIPLDIACYTEQSPSMNSSLTRWGGLSNKVVLSSALTRRARWSDATAFKQNKQIFSMLVPRTWLKVEKFRLE